MDEGVKKIPLPKISQIYPIMMKFGTVIAYLKKMQKINKSRDTPLEFYFFHRKSGTFVIPINTDIDCIIMHNFYCNSFNLYESLKVVLINMVVTLMMPAKLATPDLL